MELGYEFHWKPFSQPILTYPSGKSVVLRVDSYVPILDVDVFTAAHYDQSSQIFGLPMKLKGIAPVAPVGVGDGVDDIVHGDIEDDPPRGG